MLHAARKRARLILFTTQGNVHAVKQLTSAIDHGRDIANAGGDLLFGDIGKAREVHAQTQVRVLVNHTEDLVADKALLLTRKVKAVALALVVRSDAHVSRRGFLVKIQALHERRFARTGLAYDT